MSRVLAGAFIVVIVLGCAGSHEREEPVPCGVDLPERFCYAARDLCCSSPLFVHPCESCPAEYPVEYCAPPPPAARECFRPDDACCDDPILVDSCDVCPEGTRDLCEPDAACGAAVLSCVDPSDCELVDRDWFCCPCGLDYIARPRGEMTGELCDEECELCIPEERFTVRVPTCSTDEVCDTFDADDPIYAACESDEDCFVRSKDCCDCGGRRDDLYLAAIAYDGAAAFAARVCGASDGACDDCLPPPVPDVFARCASGICRLAER